MAVAEIERLHQRMGVRLATQPSVFSAPIPLLEYFIGVISGNPPAVPSAPTGDWRRKNCRWKTVRPNW